MSSGPRISLDQADVLAYRLIQILGPTCERIQVAGSIRRRKREVGDVELLMIPKLESAAENLFGESEAQVNRQFELVNTLVAEGVLEDRLDKNGHRARGERYQRVTFEGTPVDLFCCLPPAEWGYILMLRTGPAEFNERIVCPRVKNGTVLQIGQEFRDGALWDRGLKVATPEEEDLFDYLGIPWIAPEDRNG
ncbi:MAG: hypothetical protein ACO1SV_21840 [Fimbriimonas sp.]